MQDKYSNQEVNFQENQMLFFRTEGWGTVPSTLEQVQIAINELNNTNHYPDYYRDWLKCMINKEFGTNY